MKNNLPRKIINIDKPNKLSLWTLKELDDAVLPLTLYKNNVAFDVTGQTIKLGAKTSKGLIEQVNGFTINKNELDIELKNSILTPGVVEIDLELKDSNGSMTTASFLITVTEKVLSGTALGANSEFDTLTKAVNKIEEDYNGLKKVIIDENVSADLQNQINETNTSLENMTYLLDKSKDFTTEFNNAIDICISKGQKMKIPYGNYTYNGTKTIEYPIEIECEQGVTINISNTFLVIKSDFVKMTGKPRIIPTGTGYSIFDFQYPIIQQDKAIKKCKFDISIYPTTQTNVIGFNFNRATWDNDIDVYCKNVDYPFKFSTSWHNGNRYNGTLINFVKGINTGGDSTGGDNIFRFEFEQILNVTSYGFYHDSTVHAWNRNQINIRHWLDNQSGKYYAYYFANNYFKDNIISGNIEGLIYDNERNYFNTLYFTERDRSVINGDTKGIYNLPLITTHKHYNILKNGNFEIGDTIPIGVVTNNCTISSEKTIVKSGSKSLKVQMTSTANGFAIMQLDSYNFTHLKGKTVTLSCWCYSPVENKRNDYSIYVNDGVTSTASDFTVIKNNNKWQKLMVTHTLSTSATTLQINLGRRLNTDTADGTGDILYFDEVMLIEGIYSAQENIPNISEDNFILSGTLPTADSTMRGKTVILTDANGVDSVYMCIRGSGYAFKWVKLTTVDVV